MCPVAEQKGQVQNVRLGRQPFNDGRACLAKVEHARARKVQEFNPLPQLPIREELDVQCAA